MAAKAAKIAAKAKKSIEESPPKKKGLQKRRVFKWLEKH
jgi:hypothetical protein